MLTAADLETQPRTERRRRSRSPASQKQQYHSYIMQRIEDYKNAMTRGDLLRLGDDAARELQAGAEGQFLLTELLMQETVDLHIMKKLNLPDFKRWKQKFGRLRAAQREPNHWDIRRSDPVAAVLPRIEPGDRALIIGAGAERAAYLLAAYDMQVICLFSDTTTAVAVEGKLATESLSPDADVFVISLGGAWFPTIDGAVNLVVIDVGTLTGLPVERQRTLVIKAQQATARDGLHALVANESEPAPEAFLSLYPGWQQVPLQSPKRTRKTGGGLPGILLSAPPIPPSALTAV